MDHPHTIIMSTRTRTDELTITNKRPCTRPGVDPPPVEEVPQGAVGEDARETPQPMGEDTQENTQRVAEGLAGEIAEEAQENTQHIEEGPQGGVAEDAQENTQHVEEESNHD